MKNVVGHLPRKKNYYHRPNILRKIYRRLDAGHNLFLAAPRRMGKTSIMHYLKDHPQKGYHFIYVNVESVDNSRLFFEYLIEALLECEQISQWTKITSKTWKKVLDVADRVGKVVILDNSIDLSEAEHRHYHAFVDLLKKLEDVDVHVVLMIDELPQSIANIHQYQSQAQAALFLHLLRKIRQELSYIRFIYTGSIGLKAVVRKVTIDPITNDLNDLTIHPFKRSEALEVCERILQYYEVPFEATALQFLLDKMGSFIPYQVQLLVQQLIDLYDDLEVAIDETMVNKAFAQLLLPEHDKVFRHYETRLKKQLTANELQFVLFLLEKIANENEVNITTAKGLAAKYDCRSSLTEVIEMLQYDGYIYADEEGSFRFISLLLLEWWRKYVLNW